MNNCPGHTGVCPFCKGEVAPQRSTPIGLEVDALGNPVLDYCCTTCLKNHKHAKKFDPEIADKFR